MPFFYKIFFVVSLLCTVKFTAGQAILSTAADTTRTIQIISAKSLRQITIDSVTVLQTLAGDARVKQGNTILSGDSIAFNQATGEAEVFGNVHINDADSVHTYAQYLKYIGNERIAYLKRKVLLTDGKAVLNTEDLEYNLQTGIATYKNGGKVVNGKTVLTSQDAVYYSDTKDVFFKKNVHLVDPKYDMRADSLRYNTAFKEAYFISPTHIISEDGIIDTRSGTYNLETGQAAFYDRTSFKDSTRYISGDKIAIDDKTKVVQIEGHGKLVDSVNNVIVLADQILINRSTSSFLATRKPVMILFRNNDSTYIAADTLFSGLRKYDSIAQKKIIKSDSITQIKKIITDSVRQRDVPLKDSLQQSNRIIKDSALNENVIPVDTISTVMEDSLPPAKTDTSSHLKKINGDSSIQKIIADTSKKTVVILPVADSTGQLKTNIIDTVKQTAVFNLEGRSTDSIRYFLGFHHVRIFNDSIQAVSDSLHYSTEDSTFKLFGNPVFWNDQTQVKGDTMHLYTENQKAKRLYVFNNAITINKTKEGLFNQVGGRNINGYFKDGAMDYIRVKGSPAESIFYPQDDDSAYIGMNRSKGDVIDVYFVNKELYKIKMINDVNGTLYPLRQIPAELKVLPNFLWLDERRPKNKLELFE